MPTTANRSSTGPGLMSEGFLLAMIYVIALVTTIAVRGVAIDTWNLFVPAVVFAAAGGYLTPRFRERRSVMLIAIAAGTAIGLT